MASSLYNDTSQEPVTLSKCNQNGVLSKFLHLEERSLQTLAHFPRLTFRSNQSNPSVSCTSSGRHKLGTGDSRRVTGTLKPLFHVVIKRACQVNIFGSNIISILLNNNWIFCKRDQIFENFQCHLAKWKLFSIRKCLLQELNFLKWKFFDENFLKSCPEFQSFRLSKQNVRETQRARAN